MQKTGEWGYRKAFKRYWIPGRNGALFIDIVIFFWYYYVCYIIFLNAGITMGFKYMRIRCVILLLQTILIIWLVKIISIYLFIYLFISICFIIYLFFIYLFIYFALSYWRIVLFKETIQVHRLVPESFYLLTLFYLVTCLIFQKTGAGIGSAYSCLWDNIGDG